MDEINVSEDRYLELIDCETRISVCCDLLLVQDIPIESILLILNKNSYIDAYKQRKEKERKEIERKLREYQEEEANKK